MFLIGETKEKVVNGKLKLPKEFHLKRKTLLYKWKDDSTLILSDGENSLNFAAGKENLIGKIRTDSVSCIPVRPELEGSEADIAGHISTVEIKFRKKAVEQ